MNFEDFILGRMVIGFIALLILFAVYQTVWFFVLAIIALWIFIIYKSVYKKE